MDNKKLETLRDDINSLDDKILDLLKQRAEIVIEIGEQKKSKTNIVDIKREQKVIDRLLENSQTKYSKDSIVRIWREILSTSLKLQGSFKIAVYKPNNQNGDEWGYISATREHFGSNTPIVTYLTQRRVIEAILEDAVLLGH